jgi:Skp family chaperone for outer membrane proteins
MRRKLFTLAAALSLVVCLATALLWDLSRDIRGVEWQVVRGGAPWRVACFDGEVRVDNSPQREAEARRVEQERSRTAQDRSQVKQDLERELERELAPLRRTLDQEPYGTEAYQRALDEFRRMKERGRAANARAMAEAEADHSPVPAVTPTPEIVHVVQLRPIMGGAAVLPAAWLVAWVSRRRRRISERLRAGTRLVSGLFWGRIALVSVPWLVLALGIVVLWVRSETDVLDWLVYSARSPADRSTTWASLRSLDGGIYVSWTKRIYGTPLLYFQQDTTDPSSQSYVPDGPPLGWKYEARRRERTPNPRQRTAGRATPLPARRIGDYVSWFWYRRGFTYQRRSGPARPPPFGTPNTWESDLWAGVPHWFLLALWAVPLLLVLRRRSRAARRAGLRLCPACGYDVRATPGRCPECGTAAGGAGAAAEPGPAEPVAPRPPAR